MIRLFRKKMAIVVYVLVGLVMVIVMFVVQIFKQQVEQLTPMVDISITFTQPILQHQKETSQLPLELQILNF